ncbi:tyrosine-protein kinase Wzc [Serratia nevei]|uniref:tyrosine-protein kinase Wzc n=1 Tax=Serratia TaxID=613 RepID=UPI0021776B45|nr:tyrosine-protein kinase Wzc [Serratia marcescens]CAI1599251.1 Tyrosine-protein kinase wzc [Serratia marcescens]
MTDMTKAKNTALNSNDEIDLGRIIGILLDHRWLITAVITLFTTAGILYAVFSTPVYQADALIQVEQNASNTLLNSISEILPNSRPESSTEIELIQSRMVLGKTIDDLSLDTEIEQKYFPIFGRGLARITGDKPAEITLSRFIVPDYLVDERLELKFFDKKKYTLSYDDKLLLNGNVGVLAKGNGITLLISDVNAKQGTEFYLTKKPRLVAINDLSESLSVQDKGKDTGVLSLSLIGYDPLLVEKSLASITENYLLQNIERKSEEAGKSLSFLKEQLPAVRQSLDNAENKLNQFRQKNDSVDLSLEAKSVLDSVVSVETQLNELTFKEAEISKLYTKEHPAYRALLEKRDTLRQEKDKLNQRVGKMPKTQQEILRLTRDVDAGKEIYMQLLNKRQELEITKASTVGNVRIVDPAIIQSKPVKPKKLLIVVLAGFLGAMAAIAIVLIRTMLHRGIESAEELEESGINVYANIPLSEWQRKKDIELAKVIKKKVNTRSTNLLAIGNPVDISIEAIRSLRTSLHFAMIEAKNNVLMISGASPNIGKTFVSLNLAAVIAQAGQRVLVIDADMRKGYSHALLGLPADGGLSEILSQQVKIPDVINKTSVENMYFISRGRIPPNPSELLMSGSFSKLLEWASENYDMVLIDTPPVLAVTDAAIIGRHAGTSLMVTRFGMNTLKEVEISIRRFEQNGIDIKGVILNAVEKRASNYYGNYGYYQYEYTSKDKN